MHSRLFLLLVTFIFASCAAPAPRSFTGEQATGQSSYAQPPRDRPGLGTRWGETRKSVVETASFLRATPAEPLATVTIFYDDRAGIEAKVAASQPRRTWPLIAGPAASFVSVALRDQNGRLLPGVIVGDRWFVVGEGGPPLLDRHRQSE